MSADSADVQLVSLAKPHIAFELVAGPAVLGRPRHGAQPGLWSADDERWFERNRRFATAGKILSVVGRLAMFGALASGRDLSPPYWSIMTVAGAGELMWSGADLKATNQLRERGFHLRKGTAIASVVGAVVFAPLTWVTGTIQSRRIRELHHTLEEPRFGRMKGGRYAASPGGFVLTF